MLESQSSGDDKGTWRTVKNNVIFSPSVKTTSFCSPGPAPKFMETIEVTNYDKVTKQFGPKLVKKKYLPLAIYLNSYDSDNNTKYGCNQGQYIKYENGHYCCVNGDKKATPQEMLDYVNMAIESFFNNVGYSSAPNAYARSKYEHSVKELNFLLYHREKILSNNPEGLVDNLEVPPDIDENGEEVNVSLEELTNRYKTLELAHVDKLEGSRYDSENSVLDSMRREIGPTGNLLYTRRRNKSKFGGKGKKRYTKKNKKTKRNIKNKRKLVKK
jgi:hypothetical protein